MLRPTHRISMPVLITLVWSIPSVYSVDYSLTPFEAIVLGQYLYIDGGEIQFYVGGGNTTNLPGTLSQILYKCCCWTILIKDRKLYLLH
jgi:hypothetical protein